MDWLDEKVEIIGKWLKNTSLFKALIVYIILCILSVGALYAYTMSICGKYEAEIWSKYYKGQSQIDQDLVVEYHDESLLNHSDKVLITILSYIQGWSIIIYSISGIICVSLIFYNKKLKYPLRLLKEAATQVGNNNLELEVFYDSKDEMGDLCRTFDFMRKQLIISNQKMWDTMAEQKRLNAAFAHDLRTPLTVLRGYTDLLGRYIPEGKVSEDKLLSTISMMSNQIERLERYCNTMKQIHSFEELPLIQRKMTRQELKERIEEYVSIFNGKNSILVMLSESISEEGDPLLLDETIVFEVFENLISNALRYAKTKVEIRMMIPKNDNQILLSVSDDGKGFDSKDFRMATKPYYTESEDRSNHFGIGLYICKILCEKHRGGLFISNNIDHGAIVTASFNINNLYERTNDMN